MVELLDTLGYAGKRVAVERNGEIVPKSQHAQTTLADGDQIEIVVAVGGAESPASWRHRHPRRAAATQPFALQGPRRGQGLMICRKRRQSMSQTRLSRNAAGRHNPQRTCVKAGRPRAGQPSMEVSRLVSRLVGQRHNKTDPGTTKREPQSISPDAPPQFSAHSTAASRPTRADIWRTLVRPYVDTQIETGIQPFTAQMSGTHLGDSLISRSTCSATVQHRRTALDVRRSQVDHLLIQLFVAGGTRGDYGKNPVDIRAGSIGLLDLGQTLHTRTTLISTITLTVPRDRLPTALRSRKLHGALLDPGQARRACWPRTCRSWRSTPPA